MCICTKPVETVMETKIFARAEEDEYQVLAYMMRLEASEEMAMVLPLPVPAGVADDAVTFVDLSGYPEFFRDLSNAFPKPPAPRTLEFAAPAPQSGALKVHRVGNFEASFVPSLAAFSRLDERFQLSESVWEKLPECRSWGFAVFKLRSGLHGARSYHPMAFRFPRRDVTSVFFPTVHVHDSEVCETATFAHELYLQADAAPDPTWIPSSAPLEESLDMGRASSLVTARQRGFKKTLLGTYPNRDTYVLA